MSPPSPTPPDPFEALGVDFSILRRRLIRITYAGFALVVGIVLLAAYLGYTGSGEIQDTAWATIHEDVLRTGRGAALESHVLRQSENLLGRLAWVLALCFSAAACTAALTVWVLHHAFSIIEQQSAELARVTWHLIDNQEQTSRRFSHDMHEELSEPLSRLRRRLSTIDPYALRLECLSMIEAAQQNVRKLSQILRPVILDDFGLDCGLRWLCERFAKTSGIQFEYASNFSGRMADPLETHLFRIAQEALSNIARHSGATLARVELIHHEGHIGLTISDNGRGLLPVIDGTNLGIAGMRMRARHLKGELIVDNRKEGGLLIQVLAPFHPSEIHVEQEDPNFVGR